MGNHFIYKDSTSDNLLQIETSSLPLVGFFTNKHDVPTNKLTISSDHLLTAFELFSTSIVPRIH